MKFQIGDKVEVIGFEEGLHHSYYSGVILKIPENGKQFYIRYDEFLEDDSSDKRLCQWIPAKYIRPIPTSSDCSLKESELSPCMRVDVFVDDGWWEGIVIKPNDGPTSSSSESKWYVAELAELDTKQSCIYNGQTLPFSYCDASKVKLVGVSALRKTITWIAKKDSWDSVEASIEEQQLVEALAVDHVQFIADAEVLDGNPNDAVSSAAGGSETEEDIVVTKRSGSARNRKRGSSSNDSDDTELSSDEGTFRSRKKKKKSSQKGGSSPSGGKGRGGRSTAPVSYCEDIDSSDLSQLYDSSSGNGDEGDSESEEEDSDSAAVVVTTKSQKKSKKKVVEVETDSESDIERGNVEYPYLSPSTLVVESIVGHRVRPGDSFSKSHVAMSDLKRFHFLVKWQELGHWHNSWVKGRRLLRENTQLVRAYLKRYINGEGGMDTDSEESDGEDTQSSSAFSAVQSIRVKHRWVQVDRVIACRSLDEPEDWMTQTTAALVPLSRGTGQTLEEIAKTSGEEADSLAPVDVREKHSQCEYLVKWKGLGHAASTWEWGSFVAAYNMDVVDKFFAENKLRARSLVAKHRSISAWDKPNQGSAKRLFSDSPNLLRGSLFEYQLDGVNWLCYSYKKGTNVILGDEMGLGKTIQALAFCECLQHLYPTEQMGPHLFVVPKSTLSNWEREAAQWVPGLTTVTYQGNKEDRELIREFELYVSNEETAEREDKSCPIVKFDVMFTTYELILRDLSVFKSIQRSLRQQKRSQWEKLVAAGGKLNLPQRCAPSGWGCLIVDEGHKLKNENARLFESLKQLEYRFKVIMTGTPIQNNMRELYALLHFLQPEKFEDPTKLDEQFDDLTQTAQRQEFQELLRPHMLRRVKADVMQDLPSKVDRVIPAPCNGRQQVYYQMLLTKNYELLHRSQKAGSKTSLHNIVMQLRKVCNHPYLIHGAEQTILKEHEKSTSTDKSDQFKDQDEYKHHMLVTSSGKLELLEQVLIRLQEKGHRVLLFSQFRGVLDILEDFLRGLARGYRSKAFYESRAATPAAQSDEPPASATQDVSAAVSDSVPTGTLDKVRYRRIDGSTSLAKRERIIDAFNAKDSDLFCLLISTRAGGQGLNLASADTVIVFDPDWNPHMDIQACARVHRYGQTKPVAVFRLVTSGTVEEKMIALGARKLQMEKIATSTQAQLTTDEYRDLLKGSEKMFVETKKAVKYDLAAIDDLLDARYETSAASSEKSGEDQKGLFEQFKVWVPEQGEGESAAAGEVQKDGSQIWRDRFNKLQAELMQEKELLAASMGKGKRLRTRPSYVEVHPKAADDIEYDLPSPDEEDENDDDDKDDNFSASSAGYSSSEEAEEEAIVREGEELTQGQTVKPFDSRAFTDWTMYTKERSSRMGVGGKHISASAKAHVPSLRPADFVTIPLQARHTGSSALPPPSSVNRFSLHSSEAASKEVKRVSEDDFVPPCAVYETHSEDELPSSDGSEKVLPADAARLLIVKQLHIPLDEVITADASFSLQRRQSTNA